MFRCSLRVCVCLGGFFIIYIFFMTLSRVLGGFDNLSLALDRSLSLGNKLKININLQGGVVGGHLLEEFR